MKPLFPDAPMWTGPDGGVCVSCPGGEAQADIIEAVIWTVDVMIALDAALNAAMFLAQTPLPSAPTREGPEG